MPLIAKLIRYSARALDITSTLARSRIKAKALSFSLLVSCLLSLSILNSAVAAEFPDFSTPEHKNWQVARFIYDTNHQTNYTVSLVNGEEDAYIQLSVLHMPDNSSITLHQAVAKVTSSAKAHKLKVLKITELKDGSNFIAMRDADGKDVITVVKVYGADQAAMLQFTGNIRIAMAYFKTFVKTSPVIPQLD